MWHMQLPNLTLGSGHRWMPHCLVACLAAGAGAGALAPDARSISWMLAAVGALLACTARPAVSMAGVALALAAGTYGFSATRLDVTAPRSVAVGMPVNAAVVVVERVPVRARTGWRYLATVARDERLAPGTVVLARQAKGQPPAVGERVEVTGRLTSAASRDAPGWWRRYLERQGVSAALKVSALRVTGRRGGWEGLRDGLARRLRAVMDGRVSGDDAAVVSGVTLGFDEALSEERRDAFRRSGTAHLLAVSGQNVVSGGASVSTASVAHR